jgi:uncharacterized protein
LAVVYFDSSALVKLLVEEDGSGLTAEVWNGADAALASRIAYPEVRAALGAATRDRQLSAEGLVRAEQLWEELWSQVTELGLTTAIARRAGELAVRHALRGGDAVHLASALAAGADAVTVAVWDQRLHEACRSAGLAVAPAILPPSPSR